jgi:hypothetical protein
MLTEEQVEERLRELRAALQDKEMDVEHRRQMQRLVADFEETLATLPTKKRYDSNGQ